ncbi:MAG: tetratricopeptide repeat protein [Nitrospirota bacterium]
MQYKSAIAQDAQRYLAKGQVEKAIAEWEKLLKESPDGNIYNTIGDLYLKKGEKKAAVDYFQKAARFFREEGFSLKALALFKKIINIDPEDVESLIALGELSEGKDLVSDAIKYYHSAADVLTRDKKKDRLITVYEKILSISPFNIPMKEKVAALFLKEGLTSYAVKEYLYIARLYLEKADYEHAMEYYNKVVGIQPEGRDALLGISYLYERKGDIREAINYTKKAVEKHSQDVFLLVRYASLLKKIEAYDEAISLISKVIELGPSDEEAHKMLGDIYVIKGDRQKAWESYKTAIESLIYNDKLNEAIDLTINYRDVNKTEAGKLLISLYSKNNNSEAVFREMLSLGDLLIEGNIPEDAVDYYRQALNLHPEDTDLKNRLLELELKLGMTPSVMEQEKTTDDLLSEADSYIKYGMLDQARSILEQLKVSEPSNIDLHMRLKSLYLETGDKEMAVTECIILGELYGRAGDEEKKNEMFKVAFDIDHEDPRLMGRISARPESAGDLSGMRAAPALEDYADDMAEADFFVSQGLKQDAIGIYNKLLSIFPENDILTSKLASLHEGVSDTDQGLKKPEAGLQASSGSDSGISEIFDELKVETMDKVEAHDYETHYNLGIAYKDMGLIDDAIKEFQASRADKRFYVSSLSMLGMCYMEKGLYSLAIDTLKKVLSSIVTRDESYWGTRYDLGVAYEKNGSIREAFKVFSEIYGWDSRFREINTKIELLKGMLSERDKRDKKVEPKEVKAEPMTKQVEKKSRVHYI